jgi:hypothetical protein
MSANFEDDMMCVADEMPDTTLSTSFHPLVKLAHTYDENQTPRKARLSQKRSAINGLQTALQEGLIVPLDKDEFRWSHDRFSQAAMSMVSLSLGEQIHYKIALYYLQGKYTLALIYAFMLNTSTHELESIDPESDCVVVADHLLHCAEAISKCPNRPHYRAILAKAGLKQHNSGAHRCALSYINAALQLLDDDPWQPSTYEQTLHLYTLGASLSWVVGDSSDTEVYLDVIFEHVTEPMDRLPAYRIKSRYYYARGIHDDAFNILFACLSEFGINAVNLDPPRSDLDEIYYDVKNTLINIGLEEATRLNKCNSVDILEHQAKLGILEET